MFKVWGREWQRSARAATLCVALLQVTGSHVVATSVAATDPASHLEPFAWGSIQTGSSAHLAWGSPVAGDGTLTTTRPSGGGSLGAAVANGAPDSKLAELIAYDGGEVVAFAEGSATYSKTAHMIAVVTATDGSTELWAWGNNSHGQLGDGTRTSTQTPVRVDWSPAADEQVVAVVVGEGHSLLLTNTSGNRAVYSWGRNNVGQLGIAAVAMSTSGRQLTPRLIPTLSGQGIVDIAAGRFHSVAIDADGAAWVWGYDAATNSTSYGDLGTSGTKPRPIPVRLTDDTLLNRRATPTSYVVTNNVVTVTTSDRNYFDTGNSATTTGTGVDILDTTATLTKVGATTYSHPAQPNVAVTAATGSIALTTTSATPTAASITSNSARLTLVTGHDIRVGNRITVNIGDPAFDGERTVTGRATTYVTFASQPNVTSTPAPSDLSASHDAAAPVDITSRSLTSNTVTLTVASGHPFKVGSRITVATGDPTFDGSHTVTALSGSTGVRYAVTATNVASTITTGTVSLDDTTIVISDYEITNNIATLTADVNGPVHNFRPGNTITISGFDGNLDGTRTVTAADATTFSVAAEVNRSTVDVNGTVTIIHDTDTATDYSITSNTANLTISSGHSFEVGNQILVSGMGGLGNNLDGIKTITAVTATSIRYLAQPNVPATTITGNPATVVTDCTSSCPSAPTDLVEVAGGSGFTMARTSSGQVITWGYTHTNTYGRLGRTGDHRPAAVALPVGCVATQIDASPYNGAVVCADNRIATWGYNGHLQLGTNVTTSYVTTPTYVSGLSLDSGESIIDIDADPAGMTVLTSTGRILSWGRGIYGRNGISSTANQKTVQVATRIVPATGNRPTALFANYYTSGIADTSGTAWTWGYGGGAGLQAQGVLGPSTAPFNRVGVDPDTRIDRIDSTYLGTIVLLSDGSMWSWGTKANTSGTYFLGDGTGGSRLRPGRIVLPVGIDTTLPTDTVTSLDCSYTHCLFTTSNGSIYGWGDGKYKALVVNSTADRNTPKVIKTGLTEPVVAAGNGYSLYVDVGSGGTGGTLYAWGLNSYRRASPSTSSTSLTAMNAVKDMSDPANPVTVTDVIAVAAGSTNTIALRADGTLMAWGRNNVGQLATGSTVSTTYYTEPVLTGGRTAAAVHAEGDHVLIRATDGTLHGWGRNTNGVLGSGTVANILTPTHVAAGYTFSHIDTSGHYSVKHVQTTVGITTDGTVLAWGANSFGQLGRTDRPASTNSYSATPVVVQTSAQGDLTGLNGVVTGGGWSAAFYRIATELPPSSPLSLTASSPASGTIDLTWDAPTTPHRLVGYVITVRRNGDIVFTTGAGASSTSATLAAPDLDIVDGATHTITISAVNAAGTSEPSAAVTATPTGLPTVVRNLAIDVVVDGFDITFDPPSSDGGLALTGYTIVASPVAGGGAVSTVAGVGSEPISAALRLADGLIADTEYTVAVTASNINGPGPAFLSEVVIPGRPSAPTITSAIGLINGARITVNPPADDGGASVLSHALTVYDTGTTNVVATAVIAMPDVVVDIAGLTDGNVYDVTVRASQAADGISLMGSSSSVTEVTAGRPIAPTGVSVEPTASRTLTVSWTPVDDVPGIAVSGYETRVTVGASVGTPVARTCSTNPCTVTIGSLTNGTATSVDVRAVASGGAGPWSTVATAIPRTVPQPPASVELLPSDGTASIAFEPPTDIGGDALDAYTVSIAPTAGGAAIWSGTLDALETFTAVEGLDNGTSYTVEIRARNRAGLSSALTSTVTPATIPGAPSNVRVRPGSIIATWDAPVDNGGDPVDYYEVTVTDSDDVSTTVETSGSAACSTANRTCSITQVYTSDSPETLVAIPADMEYRVSVSAVNGQGSGEPAGDALIISSQPSEPVSPAVSNGIVSVAVCWTAPTTVPSGRSISAYRIRFADGSEELDATIVVSDLAPANDCIAPSVGHIVTEFDDGSTPTAGTTYTVTVAASASTDDYVYGVDSSSVAATPYDVPGAPTTVTVTLSQTTAMISWLAAADNGETIDAYTVTADPGGSTCTWNSGPLACEITDLADGVDHTFTVVATNDAGDGLTTRSALVRVDATPPGVTWTVIDQDGLNARLRLTFTENISGFAPNDLVGLDDCTVSPDSVGASIVELRVMCPVGTRTPTLLENSVTDTAGNTGPTSAVSGSAVTFTAPSVPSSPESPSAPTDPGGDSDPSVAPPSDPGDDGTGDSATPTSGDTGGTGGTGDTAAGGQGYANPTDSTASSPISQTPGGTLPATGADTRRDVRNSVVVMIVGLGFVMFSMRRRRGVFNPIT